MFEVTESAVMSDPQASVETLTRIRAMGIGLAIDDFGHRGPRPVPISRTCRCNM